MMIEHYLTHINVYLQAHPYMGPLFAFVVAFIESLPLIGTIFPGSVTMLFIGVLAGRGMMPLSTVLFWSSFGAFMGDTLGFWIGKHYNERLRHMWPFKKHPKWLKMSEDFFAKHGGKSIIIGRFVGPARSSVPLIAGLLKLSWPRFLIAIIPSAVLWAIAYMIPGVLIGAISLELPHGVTTKFMLISLVVVIFLWLIFWAIQRFFVFLVLIANRWVDKTWAWLNRYHSSKFFIRLLTVKECPEDHHQLSLAILLILSVIAFLLILVNVLTAGPLTLSNEPIFHLLQSIRNVRGDRFFITMTMLGDPAVMAAIAVLVSIGLAIRKQWRAAFHLIALLITAGVAISFFKWLIYSPRPMGFLIIDASSSFPSGHTAMATTIISFIAFLTAQPLQRSYRWIPYTLAGALICLVGFSRLYLGAHWLTDVLSSLFLGLAILLLTIISYRRRCITLVATTWWYIFLALAVIVPWVAMERIKYTETVHRFQHVWTIHQINFEAWWKHPKQSLPTYRINRFGNPIQPFNIQWADQLDNIKQSLQQHNWIVVEEKPVITLKLGQHNSQLQQHTPLFQPLFRQQPPTLLVIKHLADNETILELRLWQSGVQFKDSSTPLWVGTINYRTHKQRFTLKESPETTLANQGGISNLIQDLGHYQYKVIYVSPNSQPQNVQHLNWDGSILVIRVSQ